MSTQTFTTSGTWTCPAGVTSVQVQATGGGGGAGGASADNYLAGGGGAGGAGGAYAIANGVTVVPGTVYTVTVGAAGTAGTSQNSGGGNGGNGGAGGDSWFDTNTSVLAKGGSGGEGGSALGSSAAQGGQASACVGNTAYSGGNGGSIAATALYAGSGGGGSAGISSAGNNGASQTSGAGSAAGGAAVTGGGKGGNGENKSGTAGTNGEAATAPGGGGGGPGAGSATAGTPGAAAAGQIILTWTPAPSILPIPMTIVPAPEEMPPVRFPVNEFLPPQLAAAYVQPIFRLEALVMQLVPQPELDYFPDAFVQITRPPPSMRPNEPVIFPMLIAPTEMPPEAVPAIFITPRLRFVHEPIVFPMTVVRVEMPPEVAEPIYIGRAMIDFGPRQAAARGRYRVFNAAGYRFYWSDTAPPVAGSTPQATNATLPYQPSATFANGTWYLSVSYFDGVLDSGFFPVGPQGQTYLVMTLVDGALAPTPPSPPINIVLTQVAGGILKLTAIYLPEPDGENAATDWGIYFMTNGSTPSSGPTSAPTLTQAMTSGPMQILSYFLPPRTSGTTVKVQLQVYRSGTPNVYSAASTVLAAVIETTGPSAPLQLDSWPGELPSGS